MVCLLTNFKEITSILDELRPHSNHLKSVMQKDIVLESNLWLDIPKELNLFFSSDDVIQNSFDL